MLAIVCTLVLAMAGCAAGEPDDHGGDTPEFGQPVAARQSLRVLDNTGFTIGYDGKRRQAAWVAYRLGPIGARQYLPRPSFEADPRLPTPAPLARYAGPDYDRGHLAPNYAISQLYGEAGQRQTFYYSNVAPQRPRLNQLVWQRLEEIEIDEIAPRVGALWVIVGPIPAAPGQPPVAFFRLWIARDGQGGWQALAFRVGQSVRGDERLDAFIVPIDRIEAETGLDFLPELSTARQAAIEGHAAPASTFGFAPLACQPARYSRRWQDRDGIRLRYDRCANPAETPAGRAGRRKDH
ncbi:DNA/RNA non-specific endonuclease [Salinisphaera sp. T31B1]|uniref:DNA/RNA non-specific endonuclease n=1 Tax=Salinisphaera sp. T31B1 TaxID=727963 RepID=UPI0033412961